MTEIQKLAEVDALRRIAIERYEQDGGTMCECFDQADYIKAVERDGTAESAWTWHLRIEDARAEVGGAREVF